MMRTKHLVAATGPSRVRRGGFTVVEMLAVIGVIAILMAILLPSLITVRGNAVLAKSWNHMRQVANYAEVYAKDNRETVVPSAFDYSQSALKGKVRSIPTGGASDPSVPMATEPPAGKLHMGTWADILWTSAGIPTPFNPTDGYNWRYDAPDGNFYLQHADFDKNPFRATEPMLKKFEQPMSTDSAINANDLGSLALTMDEPGMFAMNNFFDSRQGNWYSTAQIRHPARALMLVDSFAGETIDPIDDPSDAVRPWWGADSEHCQVDFRYVGRTAAILFMDGHTDSQPRWEDLADLQGDPTDQNDNGRNIRVSHLDRAAVPAP